ncbi:MAG: hypothetical protein ABR571_11800 [Jatrophihabitans sp.]|uniref:hypothetical protein n=1 Tax=Jatrophihabitans sp. TaxID=1932789 RepID=UPI00390D7AFE
MHQIEVDDDVFEYLQSRAQPFVDTPNTVLRRELALTEGILMTHTAAASPSGTFGVAGRSIQGTRRTQLPMTPQLSTGDPRHPARSWGWPRNGRGPRRD